MLPSNPAGPAGPAHVPRDHGRVTTGGLPASSLPDRTASIDALADSPYLPLIILVAGFADVASGTSRFLMVAAGYRWPAAILATVQITIFITAISAVASNLDNPLNVAGYALGWGSGTWVSMWVEGRVGMGFRLVQVINHDPAIRVVDRLRDLGLRVTQLRAVGRSGDVEVAMVVVRRRALDDTLALVHEIAPAAFTTVERVDRTTGGPFVDNPRSSRWPVRLPIRGL